MKTPHKHSFKKTGKAYYTCPVDYEIVCECGEIAFFHEGDGIEVLSTEGGMRRRPEMYGLPKDFTEEQFQACLQKLRKAHVP